jgi:hypothetical protein
MSVFEPKNKHKKPTKTTQKPDNKPVNNLKSSLKDEFESSIEADIGLNNRFATNFNMSTLELIIEYAKVSNLPLKSCDLVPLIKILASTTLLDELGLIKSGIDSLEREITTPQGKLMLLNSRLSMVDKLIKIATLPLMIKKE